jgi:hypothetical protein
MTLTRTALYGSAGISKRLEEIQFKIKSMLGIKDVEFTEKDIREAYDDAIHIPGKHID